MFVKKYEKGYDNIDNTVRDTCNKISRLIFSPSAEVLALSILINTCLMNATLTYEGKDGTCNFKESFGIGKSIDEVICSIEKLIKELIKYGLIYALVHDGVKYDST